ncbi:MAG: hypothetical protein BWK79_04820 [Beggiatoa sp. IS2]|nr:MAG: hypothetical protein BWK79_04820 [Beggiatoa sp. IS2]
MSTEITKNEASISEFIDDLYAEYDERLGWVRRDLLVLETLIDQPVAQQTLLDALFRNLHTLKGLSGIVNLNAAEQLIHRMESYLRVVKQKEVQLSLAGLDALITGAQTLEQIISAHHTQSPLPEATMVVAQLVDLIPATSSSEVTSRSDESENSSSETTSHSDESGNPVRQWRCYFTPSPILAERGITVNISRERLEKIGTVKAAKPIMQSGGLIFEFLLETTAAESTLLAWQTDGLTCTLVAEMPIADQSSEESPPVISTYQESQAPIPLSTETVPYLALSNAVRIDMTRLDELVRIVGELITTRARQESHLKNLRSLLPPAQWHALQETNLSFERQLRDLRESVMRMRLVPIGAAFERMQFIVRDLVSTTHKQIQLQLSGQETEIDKFVVDKMIEPLLHLVRNAVSHGIEMPAERLAHQKPAQGTITLRAYASGDSVVIEVEDDGHGIDTERIATRARDLNVISAETVVDSAVFLDILCTAGFSTQELADLTSGRGVGMDVVKNTVSELGGVLSITTQVGIGTCFTIQLPLTLAITDALIVSTGGQTFAIPQRSVCEIIKLEPSMITVLENNEILAHRGVVVPLVYLDRLFGLTLTPQCVLYALMSGETNRIGIVVERVLGEREIVVRALNDPLVKIAGIAGATELGDGCAILILDTLVLANVASFRK